MNERAKRLFSLFVVLAIAALLVLPVVPVFASEKEAEKKEAAATQSAEETSSELEALTSTRQPVNDDPWEVTSLDISKDVDVVTAPGVEVSLEKTASESYIEMMVGETRDITFTIEVGAQASNSYYIAGNIFVQNTGDWPADVIAVSDTVWYKAGGPAWLPAASSITTTVPLGDDAIPTGGPHVYSYSGTFTLPVALSSVTAMSNLIEITISNKPDPPRPGMQDWKFHYRKDFAKPTGGGSTQVSLEDIETVEPATGLSYEIRSVTINGSDAGSLTGPWALDLDDAPFTVIVEKELTAEKAGSYVLNNKARIGDLEDEVDVEIVVKEEDKGLGSITGYKYEDANMNGALDEGESGWGGITIELWKDGMMVAETVTDTEGMFRFSELEDGDYEVKEVLPPGVANSGPLSIAVSVVGGARVVLEEHFLNYHIPEEKAEIKGHKFVDLDADGELDKDEPAMAGVTIKLYRLELVEVAAFHLSLAPNAVLVAETTSDGSGYFAFTGLEPGIYLVEEVVPEGMYATSANPVMVELSAGSEEWVYFLNAEMARVTGEKIDYTTGKPAEGVKFVLEAGEGEFYREAFSDESGLFDFGWLMPGDYLLYEIVPAGWVAVSESEREVSLANGDKKHFVFENKRLSAIYGYKWLDANGDGVHQESEEALAGVTIKLEGAEINEEAVTDESGYFRFEGLLDGQYLVAEVSPEGYYATGAVEVGVILEAGEERRVDFLNAPFAAVYGTKWLDTNESGQSEEGERGLEGVTIRLLDANGQLIAVRVTAADGSYAFEGLKAGAYTVEEVLPAGQKATSPSAVSFSLVAGEEKRVDFHNNAIIAGETVTPSVNPSVPGGTQTLPQTGLELTQLLLIIAAMVLLGALLAFAGLARARRLQ